MLTSFAASAFAALNISAMVPYVVAALIYWAACLIIEFFLNKIEKKLNYYHD